MSLCFICWNADKFGTVQESKTEDKQSNVKQKSKKDKDDDDDDEYWDSYCSILHSLFFL